MSLHSGVDPDVMIAQVNLQFGIDLYFYVGVERGRENGRTIINKPEGVARVLGFVVIAETMATN